MKEIKDIIQNKNKIRDNILKAFGVEIEKLSKKFQII